MRVVASRGTQSRSKQTDGSGASTTSSSHADKTRAETQSHVSGARRSRAFSDADLATFFSTTATLLNSGVPLIKSLEALATDETFRKATPILEALIRDIRSGSSFSSALSKHPEKFSTMVVSLVRAAEASGELVSSLERMAEGFESRREMIGQIKQALIYPTIVTVLGSGAVGFLMIFVVPVFEETYEKAGMPLPMITRALIAISGLVGSTWWIGILLLITTVSLYWHYRDHASVRSFRDRLMLRLPIVGSVIRSVIVGRFVRTFGSLLAGGTSIKDSLALTEQVVKHTQFAEMLHELRLAVARGEGIGAKLSEYRSLVPPLLTQMMILGEKSGDLGNMVMQVGRYIEKDLKRRTQRMSSLIEPLVTIVLALVIGTIAMAIYLPIFDMFKQV